jgi:hypothetical protein
MLWTQLHEQITQFQFGFQSQKSTIDCMFVLHSIIANVVSNGDKLYCACVDFEKAFDKIPWGVLWHKLVIQRTGGKLLNARKAIYSSVTSCVRFNGNVSEMCACNMGLKQGEPLSPILFILYINDMLQCMNLDAEHSFCIDDLYMFMLLFADDTVLFSRTPGGLQIRLDQLHLYCINSSINVNIDTN